MRNFRLQTQVSVDGYMAGPNGGMDWITVPASEDMGGLRQVPDGAGRHDRAGSHAGRGLQVLTGQPVFAADRKIRNSKQLLEDGVTR